MAVKPAAAAKSRYALDRRARIAEMVAQHGAVRVDDLSAMFQVSKETIRNDLDLLAKQGVMVRDRGGAVANMQSSLFVAFAQQANLNQEEKRRIGQAAAQLVQPGETIIMEAGTTLMQMARSLKSDLPVTVITNAVNITMEIGARPKTRAILLGGLLIRETVSTIGPLAERHLNQVKAGKVFLGAHSLSPAWGPEDTSLEVAHLKRIMIRAARRVILLADSSKWNRVSLARIVPWSGIHTMVTDSNLTDEAQHMLRRHGIELIVV